MRFSKIWILLLVCAMLLGSLAGCADSNNNQSTANNGTKEQSSGEDPSELYDEDGYLKDQLPEGLSFNKELDILCWNSVAKEFGCDEPDGTAINDALVKRDMAVEERLNVSLNYLMDQVGTGSATETAHYITLVQQASQGGSPFDLVALYGRTAAMLSYQGYLQNLLNIDNSYLNLENPWWTGNLMEELVVNDCLYIVSGDITPSIYEQPYTMFYNVSMVENLQVKDPYLCVKDNEWTMETFRLMTKDVTQDANANQLYGFVSSYYTVPSMMHGCGVRLMERNDDGELQLAESLFSEQTIDIVDDLQDWAQQDNFLVQATSAEVRPFFQAGQALFLTDRVIECFNFVDTCTFKYSVVPNPKLTAEQDRYYTTLDTQLTFWGTMKGFSQEDLTVVSAVLECLGSEGYRQTSPAVLDTCIKSRYAQSEQMSEMLALIIDSVYYDFGRIYSDSSTDWLCDRVGKIIASPSLSWSGYKASNYEMLKNRFQEIINQFEANSN